MIDLVLGFGGMLLILFAFVMHLFIKMHREDLVYVLCNLAGSVMLAAYSYMISGWPFFVLNTVWAVAAVFKLVLVVRDMGRGIKRA